MRYVVAYDISDDQRRRRVAHVLEAYGERVQYSVFEVDVDAAALATMVDALYPLLQPPVDGLRIYRLCASCEAAAHVLGAPVRERPLAWIV